MIVSTEAIILQGRKFGDSSKIISVFTKNFGKVSLIAKGALKPKNKFGSSIEPLNCSNLSYYKKNSGLNILSNSEVEVNLRNIRKSFEHTATAMMILESISQSQIDDDHSPELYESSIEILKQINLLQDNPFNWFIYFQLIHAKLLGFEILPHYNESHDSLRFAVDHGTYIENVNLASRKLIMIKREFAAKLLNIYNSDSENLCLIELKNSEISAFYDFFVTYFSFHFDKQINYSSFSLMQNYS